MSAPATTDSTIPPSSTPLGDFVRGRSKEPANILEIILDGFASLKLTVALMALAIVVIFIGTLAQTSMDIWEVMRVYFRAWVMWVPLEVFFPRSLFPHGDPYFPNHVGFPFVGGATVGLLMAVNLLCAHLVRFKTMGTGKSLETGWAIMGVGGLLTVVVVAAGNLSSRQDVPWISWDWMWAGILVLMAAICAGSWCGAAYTLLTGPQNRVRLTIALSLSVLAVLMSGLLGYCVYYRDEARLAESSLRILWQQTQGLIAAGVVLGGAWLVFKQRAGIVVLHTGIALLMLEQVMVARLAVESQITLVEGEKANFSRDTRATELAFIDSSDANDDKVTVVAGSVLRRSQRGNTVISDDSLPANVRVLKYYTNSKVRRPRAEDTNPATEGSGKEWFAEEAAASTGVDNDSKVDMAAAYVELTDKKTKENLGTYMVSVVGTEVGEPEEVTIGGKKYKVGLRFKHLYKDYTVQLVDVKKDDYPGTDTPMNYSSDVILEDKSKDLTLTPHIWMNNPLRYGGETFYQSGYAPTPNGEQTTLQVVSNTGWMIPYVALSYVGMGMLFHFVLKLLRFLDRMNREASLQAVAPDKSSVGATAKNPFTDQHESTKSERKDGKKKKARNPQGSLVSTTNPYGWLNAIIPVLVALSFLGFVNRVSKSPKVTGDQFDFPAFGRIPIVQEGRVKPIDTFARNELRIISNEETFKEFADEEAFKNDKYTRQPAVKWLLDVITEQDLDHKVFRIENQEVISFFKVDVRPGFFRYSRKELMGKVNEFEQQLAKSRDRKGKKEAGSVYEVKLAELESRFHAYLQVAAAFEPARLPPPPSEAEMKQDAQAAQQRWLMQLRSAFDRMEQRVTNMKLPLLVPLPHKAREENLLKSDWQSYSQADMMGLVQATVLRTPADEGITIFNEIINAYAKKDVSLFNQKVEEYHRSVIKARQPQLYDESKVNFEAWFNQASPFFWGQWIYFAALIIASSSLLSAIMGDRSVRYGATTLIVLAFALHTAAILGRLYISGRPPVTNLYSSAVFIGWACVLLGLGVEGVFRMGVGNVVSAVAGFVTLRIAYWLAVDGDTFTVLQAVLDTQFWLATHVTSITIGYSATFLAGLLGVSLLGATLVPGPLGAEYVRKLGKMIYGIVCFAMFFSFVGTVLGGLWADDSWGRFWGWDPKENGALMIVLWNALVLHAKWDRQVGDRGLAILAIGGNIVTAWSWFGVNLLGAGLHSYGFTEGRAYWLGIAILIHLGLIALGMVLRFVQGTRRPTQVA